MKKLIYGGLILSSLFYCGKKVNDYIIRQKELLKDIVVAE